MQGATLARGGRGSGIVSQWFAVLHLTFAFSFACGDERRLGPGDGYAFLIAGNHYYSAHKEELVIRSFFGDRKNGCFVDIGAGPYRDNNTTLYLEQQLEWSGFAFDRDARLGADYVSHRRRTRFYSVDVSNTLNQPDVFWDGVEPVVDHTITLDSLYYLLFDSESPKIASCVHVDLLSISVDGAEHKVLSGAKLFLLRTTPRLVIVSRYNRSDTEIVADLDTMQSAGYIRLDGLYPSVDGDNLYFAREPVKIEQFVWHQ